MAYFTDEKIEQLLDDPEVVKRLIDFISMDGAAYFEEVRSNLSPEDLEEYLKENPDERIYLKKNRTACHMTNRPSSGSSSK
mgnify:CR=1 FL=1